MDELAAHGIKLHAVTAEPGGSAAIRARLAERGLDTLRTAVHSDPDGTLLPSGDALYRNAIGDECVFVETGSGVVETVFGAVPYRAGDYVVVPRATTHRWLPAEPSRLYAIEANSHVAPPRRYLSRYGQLLEHAPYCERDLHGPAEPLLADTGRQEVACHMHVAGSGHSKAVAA